MKYKAIIADVDGTIIAPSELPATSPSTKLIQAVQKTHKKGVIFSLATARSLDKVDKVIDGLSLKSLVILDNGARIYDCLSKEYVWEAYLDKIDAEKVFSILEQYKNLNLIIVEKDRRVFHPRDIIDWQLIKIITLGLEPQKAEKMHRQLKAIPSIHVTRSISGVNPTKESIHVTGSNATKQIAVLKFSELLNIPTDQIIGIGDSYNDFPLLMGCGFKVAMANAIPDIKAIADYIAPSYQEDGVAHVLNKFILN